MTEICFNRTDREGADRSISKIKKNSHELLKMNDKLVGHRYCNIFVYI